MILALIILAAVLVAFGLGAIMPELGPEHIDREGQGTAERTWGEVFSHHKGGDAAKTERDHAGR